MKIKIKENWKKGGKKIEFEEMQQGFNNDILDSYLEVINKNYCTFLLHYNLYHEFLLITSTGEHQTKDEAEKNIEVMNKYVSVFNGLQGLLDLAIIELHKLFDKSKPGSSESTINLRFLIRYIEEHSSEVKNNKVTPLFIETCNKKINTISNKLTNLGRSRNNRSHNLQQPKKVSLKFRDIEDISKVVDELFNEIDSILRANSWSFSFFHEEPKRDINLLIQDLLRLKEISALIINNSGKKDNEEILKDIKKILHFEYF